MKKPQWFDSSLTIVGLILSTIATFNLTGVVASSLNTTKILSIISLLLGIFIVIIIVYKNKTETKVLSIPKARFFDFISDEINLFDNSTRAFFFNPSKSFNQLEPTFNIMAEKEFRISLIGASDTFLNILPFLSAERFSSIQNYSYVTNFSQDIFTIVLLNDDSKKMSILLNSETNSFLFRLAKKSLIVAIRDNVLKIDSINDYGIHLNNTTDPAKLLNLINSQKDKYISNFASLRSGHISFYGTEVLAIQSGWLQFGNFKKIRTLDITSDPGILLTRYKYIETNKDFIRNNGTIQRVYLIEKSRLTDDLFRKNLKSNIELQREIGVMIGIYYIDDLMPNQKQDFILYDDYSVLVEERQANSDYSFAKSTAYFSKMKINEYEQLFNQIWDDKRKPAIEVLNELMKSL